MRRQREYGANESHELRTPLTTIKSYTEALVDGARLEPELCLSFLTTIEKETERMVRLVKDLLVLSQLDFQQVGWHKDQYALDELITEVVAELKLKYKETARQITVSLPVEPVIAYIDRDKIKQVLLNIIHNAYNYTAEGGQSTISLEQQREQAVMQVSDDGIGIPAADVERVFERFYRVDKNRSRAYGGTGLGLPIARELVAAHGGTISLSCELQQGTTVTVTLPLPQVREEDEGCVTLGLFGSIC